MFITHLTAGVADRLFFSRPHLLRCFAYATPPCLDKEASLSMAPWICRKRCKYSGGGQHIQIFSLGLERSLESVNMYAYKNLETGGEDYYVVVGKGQCLGFLGLETRRFYQDMVGHQFPEQGADSLSPRTDVGKDMLRCLLPRESRDCIVTMHTHTRSLSSKRPYSI